jgi:hypothetical protein
MSCSSWSVSAWLQRDRCEHSMGGANVVLGLLEARGERLRSWGYPRVHGRDLPGSIYRLSLT